ncbi:MAG: DUF760 domain-containing protein [Cyanobacteriota bacterium]
MINKIEVAESFLRSLEDPDQTGNLMSDRMDVKVLYVMHKYAEHITKSREKIGMKETELIASAMIVGYLLKSHMDRCELEQLLENLNK